MLEIVAYFLLLLMLELIIKNMSILTKNEKENAS